MRKTLTIMLGLAAMPAAAQTVPPEQAFGARESVRSASLSPGGTRVAFLAPGKGQGNALYTVPVDGSAPAKLVVSASGVPERIGGCGWVSERRLICNVVAIQRDAQLGPMAMSRLVAVDIDGGGLRVVSKQTNSNSFYTANNGGAVLDWLPGEDGQVLMGRQYVPENTIGSSITKEAMGYGVDRIDTATGAARKVIAPKRNASEYISDGKGTIRIMGMTDASDTGYATGITRYFYRKTGSTDWSPLGEYKTLTQEGFNPYAVDPAGNVAYGLRKKDGRLAFYKKALDGSDTETLMVARADVDIDGPITLGRQNRVVGVTFATDRRQAEWFDPALLALRKSLGKALGSPGLINFEGASADEQKLLIWAGGDTDAGRYYLFDRTTKQLRPLILSRPELDGYTLAPVKSVMVRAGDGTMLPAYLTLPPGKPAKGLPAIVMPHGGPSSRDEWGFDWLVQYFANRGYAVLQPNYRGSSGYGDAWYRNNGFQSWRTSIGDVNDSGRWLVSEGIADPAKLAIVGWSYGGYAALQSSVVAPDLFKAIVAVAPVTDLAALKEQSRYFGNFRVNSAFIGSGPHIVQGSPAQNAAAIKVPVMLFHGDLDINVDIRQSRLMADKLRDAGKPAQLIVYPGLDHQLDDAAARTDLLGKADAFLRKTMGM